MALVGQPALDERILTRLRSDTPARRWVVDTLTKAAAERDHASARLRTAASEARKLRSRERRALFDIVYDLIRWQSALEAMGAVGWEAALELWLDGVELADLPFAARAGCSEAVAADLLEVYGETREDWLVASNTRAPMVLRVNVARTERTALQEALAADQIVTTPVGVSGLEVVGRGNLVGHRTFRAGHFEIQDLASQKVAGLVTGRRVLDLCAGAGGKSLAIAARGAKVFATDIRRRALEELRTRAKRARTPVAVVGREALATYDSVLVDAPCSGSGVWRRHPEFRWRLADHGVPTALQLQLLQEAAEHTAPDGEVVYATCSALRMENEAVVEAFLAATPAWRQVGGLRTAPHVDATDGMFAAVMRRA